MAHQHFYSRVPARVSMYNKFDSFDTFAHSRELSRDFIERELSLVYADKLSKNDMPAVRKGEIKPVYYQCNLKSGKFVQGCITYLPLDYTGERSAYLTHTLVLTDEEKKQALSDNSNVIFNKELFKTDISEFDITSPNSSPNKDYPEIDYQTKPLSSVQGLYKKYDPETIKSFIGSILLSLCKKGKNIYFKLDVNDDELSSYAVEFINEIMSILPYTYKQNLSFITYLNDYTQYPSFKLKCVSSNCPEIYQEKGVFFDFKINLVTGLDLEEIRINKTVISFLYSLLENNAMRIDFLNFVTKAIENIPSLQISNLKILSDLIFLFCGTCGYFTEENIIPNDESVLEFFNVYEKYRLVLDEAYRMRAYNVLKRYPKHQIGIPKLVFAKLSKLYPTDIKPAKRMAMNIVLELIHTDTMREKLFTFIVNNYDEEDDEIKKVINYDLCRVFYGGFMQSQILKFFTIHFPNEPLDVKDEILQKLFLTIRTISIQQKIIDFIDLYYKTFTYEQKIKFYEMVFEMLPECDALASSLVKMVNKHVDIDNSLIIEYIETDLSKVLENNYRKKESLLLPILINEKGICADICIKLIFKEWYQRKIFTHFIDLLKEKDAIQKTDLIIRIIKLIPNLQKEVEEKLLNSLQGIYDNNYNNTNLYEWFEIYENLIQANQINQSVILNTIKNDGVINGIILSVNDVFNVKMRNDGLELLREFAKENRKVRESNNYQFISKYVDMIGNIQIDEFEKAFNIYDTLPIDKQLRINIANHISACVIDRKKQTTAEQMCFDICINHLKDEKIQLEKLYNQYKDIYKRQFFTRNGANADVKKANNEASGNALKLVFDCCYVVCKTSKQLNDVICDNESKLRNAVQDFINIYGNKSKKWSHGVLSHVENTAFTNYFIKTLKECKPQSGGLFKMFKK